jgi:hypothetical protein
MRCGRGSTSCLRCDSGGRSRAHGTREPQHTRQCTSVDRAFGSAEVCGRSVRTETYSEIRRPSRGDRGQKGLAARNASGGSVPVGKAVATPFSSRWPGLNLAARPVVNEVGLAAQRSSRPPVTQFIVADEVPNERRVPVYGTRLLRLHVNGPGRLVESVPTAAQRSLEDCDARQARAVRSGDLERPRPARQGSDAGFPGTRRRGVRRSAPQARPSDRSQDGASGEPGHDRSARITACKAQHPASKIIRRDRRSSGGLQLRPNNAPRSLGRCKPEQSRAPNRLTAVINSSEFRHENDPWYPEFS